MYIACQKIPYETESKLRRRGFYLSYDTTTIKKYEIRGVRLRPWGKWAAETGATYDISSLMEPGSGSNKKAKLAQDDVIISSMPDDVITNILMRLPLHDAVRTGMLSKNWKHKWSMLSQLVFDEEFYEYLEAKGKEKEYGRIISMCLDRHKGTMAKFYLYIEEGCNSILNVQDIDNWLLILPGKEIIDFTLINMEKRPLKLTNHLFSCLKLKHLKLFNCHICPIDGFGGFPNLLSLDLSEVEFGSYTCGQFLTHCSLLEILKLRSNFPSEIKRVEIEKLRNLLVLTLPLRELDRKNNPSWESDGMSMITSSSIYQLIGCFSKLQELNLNFWSCKLAADAEVSVQVILPCVKTLRLYQIDFSNEIMVSCVIGLICACPNLETLLIKAAYEDDVPPPAVSSLQVDFSRMGKTRLLKVLFYSVRGLENEICLMKCLLDCSPFLKNMDISGTSLEVLGGHHGYEMFVRKLLKLHRASRIAEIDLDFH